MEAAGGRGGRGGGRGRAMRRTGEERMEMGGRRGRGREGGGTTCERHPWWTSQISKATSPQLRSTGISHLPRLVRLMPSPTPTPPVPRRMFAQVHTRLSELVALPRGMRLRRPGFLPLDAAACALPVCGLPPLSPLRIPSHYSSPLSPPPLPLLATSTRQPTSPGPCALRIARGQGRP